MLNFEDKHVPEHLIPKIVWVGLHAAWYYGFEGMKTRPIKDVGFLPSVKQQFQVNPDNRRDSVYVATNLKRALVYARLYSEPMVLQIDMGKLDKNKWYYDPGDVPKSLTHPNQLAYRGSIPAKAIRNVYLQQPDGKLLKGSMIKRLILVKAQAFKNGPSARNMPEGIKKDAIPIWKYVVKEYKAEIHKGKNLKEQWAIAILMFKNASTRKGVLPFDFDILQQHRKLVTPELYSKVKEDAKKARQTVKMILQDLGQKGYIEANAKMKWIFDRTLFADNRYHIAVYQKLKVKKGLLVKDVLKEVVLAYNFANTLGVTMRHFGDHITASFETDMQKKGWFYVYITLSLSKEQAEAIVDKAGDMMFIENKLNSIGKGLLLA